MLYGQLDASAASRRLLGVTEAAPLRFWLVDLDIVGRRALALLLLGVLVGEMGVDLDHLQALVAEMTLQRKELAATEQEADGIPVAAGVRARPACP